MARWEIGETEDQPYSLPPNSYGGCFVLMSPVFLIRKQAYLTDISGSFRAWCWYGLSSGEGLMVDDTTVAGAHVRMAGPACGEKQIQGRIQTPL